MHFQGTVDLETRGNGNALGLVAMKEIPSNPEQTLW